MRRQHYRRFNERGLKHVETNFEDLLALSPDERRDVILDDRLTEKLGSPMTVGPVDTRAAAAAHLASELEPVELAGVDVIRDRGLWTWIALAWFEAIEPTLHRGQAGALPRWILRVDDYKTYYRHLLAGPYFIHRSHGDAPARALAVLATPVGSPGDVVESLASRQVLVSNPVVMEVATRLYADRAGGLKSGAGSKEGGSGRRFAEVLNQLELTYDLFGLTPEGLIGLLPAEFDRFLSRA